MTGGGKASVNEYGPCFKVVWIERSSLFCFDFSTVSVAFIKCFKGVEVV